MSSFQKGYFHTFLKHLFTCQSNMLLCLFITLPSCISLSLSWTQTPSVSCANELSTSSWRNCLLYHPLSLFQWLTCHSPPLGLIYHPLCFIYHINLLWLLPSLFLSSSWLYFSLIHILNMYVQVYSLPGKILGCSITYSSLNKNLHGTLHLWKPCYVSQCYVPSELKQSFRQIQKLLQPNTIMWHTCTCNIQHF